MWLAIAGVFVVNTALILFLFWRMKQFYAARFDRLAVIIQEAMAQRDAQLAKFEALFADTAIRDANFFDSMLLDDVSDVVTTEEVEEEGEPDEREGEDS